MVSNLPTAFYVADVAAFSNVISSFGRPPQHRAWWLYRAKRTLATRSRQESSSEERETAANRTGGTDRAGAGEAFQPDVRLEILTYSIQNSAVPLSGAVS